MLLLCVIETNVRIVRVSSGYYHIENPTYSINREYISQSVYIIIYSGFIQYNVIVSTSYMANSRTHSWAGKQNLMKCHINYRESYAYIRLVENTDH